MPLKFLFLFLSMLFSNEIQDNILLFCLDKNQPILNISDDGKLNRNNHHEINSLLSNVSDYKISKWLTAAEEGDYSGEIHLNRIYRLRLNDLNRNEVINLKNSLKNLQSIIHIENEKKHKVLYQPNDVRYNQQWFLTQVQADHAWDFWNIPVIEPGSKDVLLASIDKGVDWNHTDLVNNIWQNLGEDADGDGRTIEYINGQWVLDPDDLNNIDDDNWDGNALTFVDDLIGWDPAGDGTSNDNNPTPTGTGSHGTHVAGLLAATTDNSLGIASVAFNSSIMCVKSSTDGESEYITDGYDGILYAAKAGYHRSDRGFAILNCSWGGYSYSVLENATIDVAHNDYNAIIVAAAGNGNGGEEDAAHYPSSYDNVISVTALGTNDRWNHWATYHETVDLGSPGESIMSSTNQNGTSTNAYSSWSGTSMASPVAASCIGLLSAYNPTWGNKQLETMIIATSDPRIYNVNSENYLYGKLGTGRVDAFRAISTPLFPRIDVIAVDYQVTNGNSDNIIDAGETLNISTVILNDPEWGEAISPEISLNSLSNYISVSPSTQNQIISNIIPGDVFINESNPFEIYINEATPSGDYQFELSFLSNELSYTGSSYSTQYLVKDTVSISVNNYLFSESYLPENFQILNPFPNPFNPSTTLSWELNEPGNFMIDIFDIKGSLVENLISSYHTPGFYTYIWNPANYSNGIYFVRYSFGDQYTIQKLTLLK